MTYCYSITKYYCCDEIISNDYMEKTRCRSCVVAFFGIIALLNFIFAISIPINYSVGLLMQIIFKNNKFTYEFWPNYIVGGYSFLTFIIFLSMIIGLVCLCFNIIESCSNCCGECKEKYEKKYVEVV